MNGGWIKVYRKIMDCTIWKEKPFSTGQAWIDLLLEANHEPKEVEINGKKIMCNRGETVRSLETWAFRWGWTKSKVFRFFERLRRETMIETRSERSAKHINILNYNTYQERRNDNRNEIETATETKQEVKKKRSKENTHNGGDKFSPPSPAEVSDYAKSIDFILNGEEFVDYYQSRGWMIGKNRMKDWKAAVRTWKTRRKEKQNHPSPRQDDSEYYRVLASRMCNDPTQEEADELLKGFRRDN